LSEVVRKLNLQDDEIVVNVQGDEPLIPPDLITDVAKTLSQHLQASIATTALAIHDPAEINNPNVVKVVMSQSHQALYFSRSAIPFTRNPEQHQAQCYRHIGMYAYRASFLKKFSQLPPAPIEEAEALEQLRALWHGHAIQVLLTDEAPPPGVDTAEDLERVRQVFASLGKS
jgi:3-deoxy-manno-octulosonate cytidylyltransferase (CMP-KDO synthetase)